MDIGTDEIRLLFQVYMRQWLGEEIIHLPYSQFSHPNIHVPRALFFNPTSASYSKEDQKNSFAEIEEIVIILSEKGLFLIDGATLNQPKDNVEQSPVLTARL